MGVSNLGGGDADRTARFFTVEHPLGMIVAIALIHVGAREDSQGGRRRAASTPRDDLLRHRDGPASSSRFRGPCHAAAVRAAAASSVIAIVRATSRRSTLMRSSTRRTSGCSAAAVLMARFTAPPAPAVRARASRYRKCGPASDVRPGRAASPRVSTWCTARHSYRRSNLARRAHRRGELLASCYRTALALARQHQARSIAFPAISCGVYGYPLDEAAAIAVRETRARESEFDRSRSCLRSRRPRRPHHMPVTTVLTTRSGCQHPIIQAPMAGGGDTPALVAAVCEAGALGSIGATYLTPQQIADTCAAVRVENQAAVRHQPVRARCAAAGAVDAAPAVARVAPYFEELGLAAARTAGAGSARFRRAARCGTRRRRGGVQLHVRHAAAGRVATGESARHRRSPAPRPPSMKRLRSSARASTSVVAQGSEAGGHRGTFAGPADDAAFEAGMIGTLALVPQIVDAVRVPVVASGGIMDGRGIAAVLALGAAAAQLGTAFLTCEEAGVPDAYKQAHPRRARGPDAHHARVLGPPGARHRRTGSCARSAGSGQRAAGRMLPAPSCQLGGFCRSRCRTR